jgi:hypothetical protein
MTFAPNVLRGMGSASLDGCDIRNRVAMRIRFPLQTIYVERHHSDTVLDGGEFVLLKAVPGVAVQPEGAGDEFVRRRADRDDVLLLPGRLGGSRPD